MRFIALFICLSIVGISGITRAQQKDTIRVSNFGAHPYTYENCVTCLQEAISECKRSGARVLSFEKGRYDIWPEGAIRRKYFISNTSTVTASASFFVSCLLHATLSETFAPSPVFLYSI